MALNLEDSQSNAELSNGGSPNTSGETKKNPLKGDKNLARLEAIEDCNDNESLKLLIKQKEKMH